MHGFGPGLHQQLRLNGTRTLTFTQLEDFVHRAAAQDVPAEARVELHTESADRPGELDSWSIEVSWTDQNRKTDS